MIEVATSELRHSPLTFEWNEDTMTQKSNHGDFDPFGESNENSLASDDHSEFSRVPKSGLRSDVDEASESGVAAARRKRRSTTPSSDVGGTISRRKKKPKGMPKRPLSAYNFFFHYVRSKILETAESSSERIGFEGMAKIIGKQWQALSAEDRKEFEELAENDTARYRREMESYNEVRAKRIEEGERNSATAPSAESVLEHASFTAPVRAYENDVFMPHSTLPPQQHDLFMAGSSTQSVSISSREEFSRLHALTAPSGNSPFSPEMQHQRSDPGPSESMSPPLYRFRHDEGYHNGIGTLSVHQVALPPPPPNAEPVPPPSSFHMPPGMEIVLSDRTGQDRKYRVQYTCYSMTRDAARNYIDGWTGTSSRDRGTLPPPQQYHQMQMQMSMGNIQTHRSSVPTNSAWMPF